MYVISRLLGAWCLFICFTEGRPLPNYPWPIYSTAMLDCTVTCSSFSKKEKLQIQEKVQYMGGVFTQTLSANCTHLVTNSVKSEKYIVSITYLPSMSVVHLFNVLLERCSKRYKDYEIVMVERSVGNLSAEKHSL